MAGFIDAAVQDIDNRLKELKEEEGRLLAARAALSGGSAARRGPGRPPRSTATAPTSTRRRPGRPRGRRGGNTRSAQALELVRNQPGITIPEIATAMKIEPNYLYRVMPKLTSDGLVTRDGQGWHAAKQSGE
ncbi:MAG TPA: hypothetical protein VHU61_01695 [Solirubrobacteraceae bacterium]|jgi:hypothetical protein|nr:hypothetical protein [Solirubrobacteraceae bacterium]